MEKRERKGKVDQGFKYVVREGNQTVGGRHTTECTDVELYCCTPENHIKLLTSVTSNIFNFKNFMKIT